MHIPLHSASEYEAACLEIRLLKNKEYLYGGLSEDEKDFQKEIRKWIYNYRQDAREQFFERLNNKRHAKPR